MSFPAHWVLPHVTPVLTQKEAPAALSVPVMHVVHKEAPKLEYVPARHGRHTAALVAPTELL